MIRAGGIEDLGGIVEIYNQAVDAGFQTAYTERVTVADRIDWFNEHAEHSHPIFVYLLNDQVAGWVSISPYRSGRAALRFCVEISYFVHRDYQRRGIGRQLLQHAITASRELQYRVLLAIIIDKNIPSMQLAEKTGFERWGYLPGVAEFDGEVCGHLYYGQQLKPFFTRNLW